MAERTQISIPAPNVNREDRCFILIGRAWREGVCIGLEYQNNFGSFYWAYTVRLKSLSGTTYRRYVGDDGIRATKP